MAFVDTMRIFRHWDSFPPVRAFVAAFVGFKPPDPHAEGKHLTRDEFVRMIKATGGKL